MATRLMSRKSSKDRGPVKLRESSEPTVRQIIASGRSAPANARGTIVLTGLTALLMWASFTPLDWGALAWICLVPVISLIRLKRRTRWMFSVLYVGGLVFNLAALQWMRLGDPSMYLAWFALASYMAIYLPLFVALSRVAVHRFSVPLTVAVPVVWVGLEYLRGTLMTGFAWYFLSHTQYRWIELIQISDLVGAYGVSFVIAMMSACVAGLLPQSLFAKLHLLPDGSVSSQSTDSPASQASPHLTSSNSTHRQKLQVAICLAVFAAVLGYGYVRRGQAAFQGGPRVALIQGNFTTSLKHDPNEAPTIFRHHDALTGMAVKHQPDVIIWPETMFRWPLHEVSDELTDEDLLALAPPVAKLEPKKWIQLWRGSAVPKTLVDMSQKAGAAMVIGIDVLQAQRGGLSHYNSAVFIRPDKGISSRYDKLHRVPFGEYMPLKDEVPWLHKLTPFPSDFGIAKGDRVSVFDYQGYRFAPIICFEDTVPDLVRGIVHSANATKSGKSVACLVNLTNDGWFHGSSELDQHLITALFRCVECRTPMVRAVNTGISAVIDGDGVVREPEVFIDGDGQERSSMRDPKTGRWHKQLNAALVDTVPLDNRTSLYATYGDWFAGVCCFCTIFCLLSGAIPRRRGEVQATRA